MLYEKALSVMMATAMTAAALTGCGGGSSSSSETQAPAANGVQQKPKQLRQAVKKKMFLTGYGMPVKPPALYPFWVIQP